VGLDSSQLADNATELRRQLIGARLPVPDLATASAWRYGLLAAAEDHLLEFLPLLVGSDLARKPHRRIQLQVVQ